MTKKTIYIAEDGKEFYNQKQCLDYEDKCQKNNIGITIVTHDSKAVTLTKADIQEFFQACDCDNCPFERECNYLEKRFSDEPCICDFIYMLAIN